MKKIYALIATLATVYQLVAQAPDKMSYQAVIRKQNGDLVTEQVVGMRISIVQGSPEGVFVYEESHAAETNENGLLSIEIGAGMVITGTFADINWASGPYYLKTETDPAGGTAYSITGVSQLLSVPYALYAKSAGGGSPRIIRGTIDSNGSIVAGTGFTASRTGDGKYTITYTTPFTSKPILAVSAYNSDMGGNVFIGVIDEAGNDAFSAKVLIRCPACNPPLEDRKFDFIAVGVE